MNQARIVIKRTTNAIKYIFYFIIIIYYYLLFVLLKNCYFICSLNDKRRLLDLVSKQLLLFTVYSSLAEFFSKPAMIYSLERVLEGLLLDAIC